MTSKPTLVKPADEKSERAPRFREKRKSSAASQSQKAVPIYLDRRQISEGVPPHVKIAIADAMMEFANMEAAVEVFIWEMTGLNFDDCRMLTKLDASVKFGLAKDLSERYGVLAPQVVKRGLTMWSAMRELLRPRNQIAHGIWVMIDLKIPAAASYRTPSEPGKVAADSFTIERLEAIARQSRKIRECLDRMIDEAHSWRMKHGPRPGHLSIPQPIP